VLGDVEHAARLAVVGLVGHALLEGAVTLKKKYRDVRSDPGVTL
jgi:hypothetical protein